MERATTNTDYRTTFISAGETDIKAGECHVYEVPIPESMRRPGDDYDILIEVSLSYVAQPRRTRRNLRRYLSTWVDWKSSRLVESLDSFRRRALKDQEDVSGASFSVYHRSSPSYYPYESRFFVSSSLWFVNTVSFPHPKNNFPGLKSHGTV